MTAAKRKAHDLYGGNLDVVRAYSPDLNKRTLMLKGVSCSLDEWKETMLAATPGGYNNFEPNAIYALFSEIPHVGNVRFVPGREYSVVVYLEIEGNLATRRTIVEHVLNLQAELDADEVDAIGDEFRLVRIWWD
jgi:hypothetical protein